MIVNIVECCENCKQPHTFDRNKRYGTCTFLAERHKIDQKISRFSRCRFYVADVRCINSMRKEL